MRREFGRTRGICIAAAAACACTCGTAERPQYEGRGAVIQFTLHRGPSAEDVNTVQECWRGLLRGMASDPASLALLRRLYSDLAVRIESSPGFSEEAMPAPPPGGSVVVRIRECGLPITLAQGDFLQCKRDVDYVRAGDIMLEVRDGRADSSLQAIFGADLEALRLAAEDYLSRRVQGWHFQANDAGILSPEAHRADLERRIQAHVSRYKWSRRL